MDYFTVVCWLVGFRILHVIRPILKNYCRFKQFSYFNLGSGFEPSSWEVGGQCATHYTDVASYYWIRKLECKM